MLKGIGAGNLASVTRKMVSEKKLRSQSFLTNTKKR